MANQHQGTAIKVPLQAILLAIFIHSLWGGNPVAVKFSLWVFPPLWSGFLRFAIAILCITLWAKINRIPIWPRTHEWPRLLILGLIFTLQIATMNIAIDNTTGALASILIATNPLFAVCFAHLWVPDDRLSWLKSGGLLIAFAGIVIMLMQDLDDAALGTQLQNIGNWIMLFSAALLGARLAFSARLLRQIDTVRVLIWQMAFSLPLFAAGGLLWETIVWERLSWEPIAGIAYQGFVIAGLGFMVSSYLIKNYQPSVMMSFNFISPLSGVLLSIWLLGEPLTWHILVGMLAVALGLVLITRQRLTA